MGAPAEEWALPPDMVARNAVHGACAPAELGAHDGFAAPGGFATPEGFAAQGGFAVGCAAQGVPGAFGCTSGTPSQPTGNALEAFASSFDAAPSNSSAFGGFHELPLAAPPPVSLETRRNSFACAKQLSPTIEPVAALSMLTTPPSASTDAAFGAAFGAVFGNAAFGDSGAAFCATANGEPAASTLASGDGGGSSGSGSRRNSVTQLPSDFSASAAPPPPQQQQQQQQQQWRWQWQ